MDAEPTTNKATREQSGGLYEPAAVTKRSRQAVRLCSAWTKGKTEKELYVRRFASLKQTRQSMESIWRQVRDYMLPSLGRYLDENSDPNNNDYTVSYSKILDPSATKMAITAADGLHGGLTNQAEQWFDLYVGNYKDYTEKTMQEGKDWVESAQECTRDTMANSNFYSEIYTFYLELLGFGTACMMVLSDPLTRARYYTKTAGSYWLSQDSRGRIDTVYLKYTARAEDIVRDYGEENAPDRIKEAIRTGNADKRYYIVQCIQPWDYFGKEGEHQEYKFEDVRYVEGGDLHEPILWRGGYRTRPFVAARWTETGDSVYGRSSPGIDALPDIKMLQVLTKDYLKGIKWTSDPAFVTIANDITSVQPGNIYRVEGNPRDNMLQPLMVNAFDIPANAQTAQAIRERISTTLYNREILLVQSRNRQLTATEVNQLVQEKNTVLGPIIARIGDNVLIPCLDRTLEIITQEWHVLDEPPFELQGQDIRPYFTGELAKAQRQGGIVQQIQQTLQIAGGVAQLDPNALAAFDLEGMIRSADEAGLFLTGTIRTKDESDKLKAQQQQAQQQAAQAQAMQQAADTAKTAGEADMSPNTLLGQLAAQGAEQEGAA